MSNMSLFVRLGLDAKALEKGINQASAKMQAFGKRMTSMGKTMSLAVTAPLTAMAAVSVKAFATQEKAENQLRAALIANGRAVESLHADYMAFASEMQKLTVVGDESTLKMLQQAESMGITGEAAKRAARNAISLASAMGMNAESALRYTAALEQGDSTMLNRYLPTLRAIEDDTERAAAAQEMLAGMFDIAKEEAKTTSGQLQQMRNTVGDLQEQFGKIIAEAILPLVSRIKELAERFQGLSEEKKRTIVVIGALAAALGPVLIILGQMAIAMGALAKASVLAAKSMRRFNLTLLVNPYVLAAAAIAGIGVAIYGLIAPTKAATIQELRFKDALEKEKSAVDDLATALSTVRDMRKEDAEAIVNATKLKIKSIEQEIKMLEFLVNEESAANRAERIKELEKREADLISEMTRGINVGTQLVSVQKALDAERNSGSAVAEKYNEKLAQLRLNLIDLNLALEANTVVTNDTKEPTSQMSTTLEKASSNAVNFKAAVDNLNLSLTILAKGLKKKDEGSIMDRLIERNQKAQEEIERTTQEWEDGMDKVKSSAFDTGMVMGGVLTTAINGVFDAFSQPDPFSNLFNSMEQLVKQIIFTTGKAIVLALALNAITGGGASAISAGGGALGSLFGGFFANGGVPPVGKPSIVGEQGPELFVPSTRGAIIPNHMMGGGFQTVQVEISGDKLVALLNRQNYKSGRL